jgi:flagellar hook protein FlgE
MPLIGTLTSGVSALRTFSKGLEAIGGNIANVNTTGYKSASASFADTFSNTVRTAAGGNSSAQIGSGVQLAGIATDFTQGSLSSTGKVTDLALSGKGYFVVDDGVTQYATRDGAFHFDSSGKLVNQQGKAVQGVGGVDVTITNADAVSNLTIGTDGLVTAYYSDGTVPTTASAKIGVMAIPDETELTKQGNNLYDFSAVSGSPTIVDTSVAGLGKIQSGALELSNVDLTAQFADLITTQRSFQAGSRLVTVSDSILEDIVNLKR